MKNSKYNIINVKLYIDALKQLKLIGLICLGVLAVMAVMIPVGRAIEINQYRKAAATINQVPELNIITTDAYLFMYLIFIIVAPAITLYIFSFLTKRNACDYFHAFPQKRGCLYLTYLAAAVTWLFTITVTTGLLTGITQAILSKYFLFSYWDLAKYSFAILLCSLLVAASISLACSITGTIFTNIVVTGLILFLPRFIIIVAVNIVTSNLNILVSSKVLPLLDYSYNSLINALSVVLAGRSVEIYQSETLIYTGILICLYIIIARILFIKRKSETAGNPSANSVLQCVIRLGIAIPVSLIPLGSIFMYIIGKSKVTNSALFYIAIEYMIAVGLMLLYELISTKKLKSVVRSLPSVGILAVVNIFILLGLYGIYQQQLNYFPSESDVKYVVVDANKEDNGMNEMDYFEYAMKDKKIVNQEFKQFLLDILEKNIGYEKSSYPFVEEPGVISSSSGAYTQSRQRQPRYHYVRVGFKSGITIKYRRLYLDEKEYEKYISLLLSSDDIKNLYLMLPEYDKNLMSFSNGFSAEQNEEIYNSLREELKNIDYSVWYSQLYEERNVFVLPWNYNIRNQKTITILPLSRQTPKTLIKYINIANSEIEESELKDNLKKIVDGSTEWDRYNISMQMYDQDYTDYTDFIDIGSETQSTSGVKKLYDALETGEIAFHSDNTVDMLSDDKRMVLINWDYYQDDKNQYKSLIAYTTIDEDMWNNLK